MTPRIPLAYASLLVIALVAVIGFAAFSPPRSPSTSEPAPSTTVGVGVGVAPDASARVASAILALRVASPESRVATTVIPTTTTEPPAALDEPVTPAEATVSGASSPSTTTPPTTTPPTTAPPTTTPRDTTPPPLTITSHSDGEHVTDSYIVFRGTSEPGAIIRSGPFDADVSENGDWSIGLVVVDGVNGAIFTAVDKAGNSSDVRIIIHYDKPQATTTTRAPSPTTTSPSTKRTWSPLWPADAGGTRNVEVWRALVEKYWAPERVETVLCIIFRESTGNPRAYNTRSGAEGLMQHLPRFWKARAAAVGFRDADGLYASPYNAEANIAAGAYTADVSAARGYAWHRPWSPVMGDCSADSSG